MDLFWQAKLGNVAKVKHLIATGASVNSGYRYNDWTPLHQASSYGHIEITDSLIRNDAKVNATTTDGWTPLSAASRFRNAQILHLLIKNNASVNAATDDNWTPLHFAVTNGDLEITTALINANANVNAIDDNMETPLHLAALNGHIEVTELLINKMANVNAIDIKGRTPYDVAEDAYRKNKNMDYLYRYRKIFKYLKRRMETIGSKQSHDDSNKEATASEKMNTTQSEKKKVSEKDIELPWLIDDKEFERMLSDGEFLSYENRLSLGGPCQAGKSTLASVLIGEEIPLQWKSTDGLVIFFGRNGIDIEKKKMVPFKEGKRRHEIFAKMLLGKPDILQNPDQVEVPKQHRTTTIHSTSPVDVRDEFLFESPINDTKEQVKDTDYSTEKITIHTNKPMTETVIKHTSNIQTLEFEKLQLQSDILEEVRNGQYKIEIAPSDLIDFGGQKSYDMTHQLFIQHSGSFLLMFDCRFGLHNQLEEYPEGVTAAAILKHWVDSILTYVEDTEDIMPMIMFAATHKDLCKRDTAKMTDDFIIDLKQMFSEHEKKNHIFLDTVYFINGIDKNDTEIQRMTDQVVLFAMEQLSWGQRRPMQWVPLQMQIGNMRMKNINIVTKEDLRNINKLNDDLALNEQQLNDFLLVQHSLGKLMYYDLPWLDNFIIIHPPALVNILRSFVTDEKFFPADQSLRSILLSLTVTGKIYKTDLLKLWQQDQFYQLMSDDTIREFVVQLLIHLDILIIPKAFKHIYSSSDVYFVPCMIKDSKPTNFYSLESQGERTVFLRYSLARHSIPTALAYKIIGGAINAWPLKDESHKPCLYHKAAVLNVSEDNELRISIDENKVMLYMTNRTSLLSISPDVAASVQECLTKNLQSSLLFHYNSFGRKIKPTNLSELYKMEVGIQCGSEVCFKSSSDAMTIDSWICRNGKEHQTKYLRYWTFNKAQKTCGRGCKGLTDDELKAEPSDKHLVRMGSQIGIESFREFFINLGMEQRDWEATVSEYFGHSSQGIMAMALKTWKNSKISKLEIPTLKDLLDALTNVKLDNHVICQIFREKSELSEIANFNLQLIPSDQHLKELSKHIGNCPLHLGIELGLSFTEIEQSLFSFPKDLPGLLEDILAKWKKMSKVTTIHSLMMVLERVNAGGLRYLLEISNLPYTKQ